MTLEEFTDSLLRKHGSDEDTVRVLIREVDVKILETDLKDPFLDRLEALRTELVKRLQKVKI